MAYLKNIVKEKVNNIPSPARSARVGEKVIEAGYIGSVPGVEGNKNKKIFTLILVAVVVGGLGFGLWKFFGPGGPSIISELGPAMDPKTAIDRELSAELNEGPKTVASPINGTMYTEKRSAIWKKRRPLAVVIENHVAARPPYGLSDADEVFEAIAEGGITRFVAIFHASQAPRLEPIRSVRSYFLDWVGEVDAFIVHHGGASSTDPRTDALGNIEKFGISDIDCIREDGGICTRDNDRVAPHNSMSNTAILWQEADKRGFNNLRTFDQYQYKEDTAEGDRPATQNISYNFWNEEDYLVRWEYDKATNTYKRFNGNLLTDRHMDTNYPDKQIAPKVVIVQKMTQGVVDDGTPYPHLLFETVGTGQALIFMDGKQITGTWEKKERTKRTKFVDGSGQEIVFNRGQMWISVVPPENLITVN